MPISSLLQESFLYGDRGASLSLKRYFSDMSMQFDISRTQHDLRGTNNVAKLTLSMPFGPKKRFQTDYFDIQGGDLTYERRKTLVASGETSYAQPHHLKEVDNDFTLEKYYLDNGRFHPSYIETNSSPFTQCIFR